MKRIVALAFVVVIGVEAGMWASPFRVAVLPATGVALGVAIAVVLLWILEDPRPPVVATPAEDARAALDRWQARTETLIEWAESSRQDWDRHLRPLLAREFEMASGHRRGKDTAALRESGRMLFGDRLWLWVDPRNVARNAATEPAPGRAVLDEILQRLERL